MKARPGQHLTQPSARRPECGCTFPGSPGCAGAARQLGTVGPPAPHPCRTLPAAWTGPCRLPAEKAPEHESQSGPLAASPSTPLRPRGRPAGAKARDVREEHNSHSFPRISEQRQLVSLNGESARCPVARAGLEWTRPCRAPRWAAGRAALLVGKSASEGERRGLGCVRRLWLWPCYFREGPPCILRRGLGFSPTPTGGLRSPGPPWALPPRSCTESRLWGPRAPLAAAGSRSHAR